MASERQRWAPQKKDTMQALAQEILHNYGRGRVMIAVDGRRGAGTREFADALADTLRLHDRRVFRASIDAFMNPRETRERGMYTSGYDYSLFRRILADPYRTGGSTGFVLSGFDAAREEPVHQPKWMSAGSDALLVVDGVFLNRAGLSGLWHYSIWVETPTGTGDDDDASYIAAEAPSAAATAIYDNADPEHPRRIFADSC
ncbi:MAG: uridine kinase [Homoserinimonas sp.]|jgi:uridine kinase|nr:uridine kinase [Homoserinimonas sp.]